MSASTEKKLRQAAREAGTDKKTLALEKEAKEKARKERNHHLIQVGGIVEKYVKVTNLEAFEGYIKQWEGAIRKTQEPKAAPPRERIERPQVPEYGTSSGFVTSAEAFPQQTTRRTWLDD